MLHTLPDELGQLSALQVLNACGNDGLVLPLTMTQLTCLRVLDLSQTCANVGELLAAGTTRYVWSRGEAVATWTVYACGLCMALMDSAVPSHAVVCMLAANA